MTTFLRLAATVSGVAIIIATIAMLRDGEAVLGLGGMRMYPSSLVIHVDTPLELALTILVFGGLATGFLIAGLVPQIYRRTPLAPILALAVFAALVVIGALAPAS